MNAMACLMVAVCAMAFAVAMQATVIIRLIEERKKNNPHTVVRETVTSPSEPPREEKQERRFAPLTNREEWRIQQTRREREERWPNG